MTLHSTDSDPETALRLIARGDSVTDIAAITRLEVAACLELQRTADRGGQR